MVDRKESSAHASHRERYKLFFYISEGYTLEDYWVNRPFRHRVAKLEHSFSTLCTTEKKMYQLNLKTTRTVLEKPVPPRLEVEGVFN